MTRRPFDPLRLYTPTEVAAEVARGSEGACNADRIMASHHQGLDDVYCRRMAMFIWATQTCPPQGMAAIGAAWGCTPQAAEQALTRLDKESMLDPENAMNRIAVCLWPEHPFIRGSKAG